MHRRRISIEDAVTDLFFRLFAKSASAAVVLIFFDGDRDILADQVTAADCLAGIGVSGAYAAQPAERLADADHGIQFHFAAYARLQMLGHAQQVFFVFVMFYVQNGDVFGKPPFEHDIDAVFRQYAGKQFFQRHTEGDAVFFRHAAHGEPF